MATATRIGGVKQVTLRSRCFRLETTDSVTNTRRNLCAVLPTKDVRKDQWRYDGGIRVDHESRRLGAELDPRDLLVGDRARIRAVRRRRVGDLREVLPQSAILVFEILDDGIENIFATLPSALVFILLLL